MRELINDRKNKFQDPTARELDELIERQQSRSEEGGTVDKFDEERQTVENTHVPIYGTLRVDLKDSEAVRVLSVNMNGLGLWKHNNPKVDRLKEVLSDYKVDVLGLQETNTNFNKLKSSHTLASSIRRGDDRIRSVQAQNKRELENVGDCQAGGTAVVLRDELAGLPMSMGTDPTDLGMFCWYKSDPVNGVSTVFVSAYAPCRADGLGTYYQHIERYIKSNQLKTNPKDLFRRHLVEAVRKWRSDGNRVVLMIDANENVYDGVLSRRLAEDDIRMREAVHKETSDGSGPKTYFRGKDPIDGIFVSDDIDLIAASYLPFDSDLGDHRPVIIDVHMQSVVGDTITRIVPPKARRLNSKIPRIRNKYLKLVNKGFRDRRIAKRIAELERVATYPPTQEVEQKLERLDILIEEILLHAEAKCRVIYPAHYQFSPQIKAWLDKCQLLKWIINKHLGKNINAGNMRRFAKRKGLSDYLRMKPEEVVELYKQTKARTKELLADSPFLRKRFLFEKLNDAVANEREQEAKRVQQMLRSEAQRTQWQAIKRATKGSGMMNVTRVEVEQENGSVMEYTSKEDIEEATMAALCKRFNHAASAPICQGALFDLLGMYADTDAAIKILEGTFEPPPGTDQRTILVLEEIAEIWKKIGEGEVSVVVSTEDYQFYWKKARERTSSSISGLHFGHYKSIAHDDELSELMAKKLSLITKTGATPERWARGLTVMLEKIAGVALVSKLRAILLLEADYNFCNKLIFGKRMLKFARERGMVPEEIYSSKGRTAEDAILQQVLMYDIARMTKRPLLVAQVDAAQCYDRVALPFASLTLQAYSVPQSATMAMLRPLHNMEFYLRTGYGQSETYFGGKEVGTQGLAQGSGAAPSAWMQVSTVTLNTHKTDGHGVEIECPISGEKFKQVGILYVDDTNLWEGLEEDDDILTTAAKGQKSISDWNATLGESGGALRAEKCGATIHAQVPDGKGGWVYVDQQQQGNEDDSLDVNELDEVTFHLPTSNGGKEPIDRLPTNKADNNLGLFARPDGKSDQHFEQMQDKVETWTARIKSGQIPTKSAWMSYTNQLWAGLRYGLGACSAPLSELQEGLRKADYHLLSNLGVTRSITKEWRYLPTEFGGMGLFDLPIETAAANLTSFLQHYGTQTALGTTLKAALQHLQLELGVPDCPFQYDFATWSPLATDSWPKALWEKIDELGITVDLKYDALLPPREKDRAIMDCMVELGLRGKELQSVNRIRRAQESLFLSDIVTANGKYLEQYLLEDFWNASHEGQLGRHRSKLSFGKEEPCDADWKVWKKALKRLTSTPLSLFLHEPLGNWINPSFRIWRCFLNLDTRAVEILTDNGIHEYAHDEESSDRTSILRPVQQLDQLGTQVVPATVKAYEDDSIKLVSQGKPLFTEPPDLHNLSFLERLRSKGGKWMWESISFSSDLSWIVEAIQRGSLFCCTDGSYMKELAPDLCGAGWVLYCEETHQWIKGEFVEYSKWAGNYRAEQLGMLAIHIILLTVEEHYGTQLSGANIFCDNLGTIYAFKLKYDRVPGTAKNNDILRVLRKIQRTSALAHKIEHVKAHQDDHCRYDSLSLQSRLNCDCDDRAKKAIRRAKQNLASLPVTLDLPLEDAVVVIDGIKQTANIAKDLRYTVGRAQARQFYADENIMDNATFDSVAWEALKDLLEKRPKMYQLWYAKQCSGFCGTGQMITRYDKSASSNCPNCGCFEKAEHLNKCRSKVRKGLLLDSIHGLQKWMADNFTHPELQMWLPSYIGSQGSTLFVDLTHRSNTKMTQRMRQVGNSLDRIGWRHVLEGKISLDLIEMQSEYLRSANPLMSIESWTRGLLDQLLSLSHTQWICRNLTKHHRTKGTKALASREEILKEVENQLNLGMDGLSEDARCLLEIPPEVLFARPTQELQYWLNAAIASRQEAGIEDGGVLFSKEETTKPPEKTASSGTEGQPKRPAAKPSQPAGNVPAKLAPIFLPKSSKAAKNPKTAPAAAPTTTRQQTSRLPPPLRHQTREKVGLLRRNSDEELQAFHAGELLRNVPDAFSLIMGGGHQVSDEGLRSLRAPQWVNDEVIDNYFRRVLMKKVTRGRVYFCNSFFMGTLLQTGEDGLAPPSYNYNGVKSWDKNLRRRNKILGVQEIFVPINVGRAHWLLLRANTVEKTITLWDSQGQKEDNQLYLRAMKRYLGDKYKEIHGSLCEEWFNSWTLNDESANCPRQTNGYDCGVFVMANATLLAQRIELSSTSYREVDFQVKDTRGRIAWLLWEASINQPALPTNQRRTATSTSNRRRKPSGGKQSVKPTTNKPKPPTKRGAATAKSSTCKGRNRRRRNNKRLIPGGPKTRGKVLVADESPLQQTCRLLNKKRKAESIASAQSQLSPTTQRHAPRKRRKKSPSLND